MDEELMPDVRTADERLAFSAGFDGCVPTRGERRHVVGSGSPVVLVRLGVACISDARDQG